MPMHTNRNSKSTQVELVELRRQEINGNNLFDCLHLRVIGITNEHGKEIVFVDYILPI